MWDLPRGQNVLDSGAPWYELYETSDGGYMTVATVENHFYAIFLSTLLSALHPTLVPSSPPTAEAQMDRDTWPSLAEFLTRAFKSKTRDEWTKVFLGTDSCCVPMLERQEVDSFGAGFDEPDSRLTAEEREGDGGVPVAVPRLTRTPARGLDAYKDGEGFFLSPGQDTLAVLQEAGVGAEAKRLAREGAVELDDSDVKSKL